MSSLVPVNKDNNKSLVTDSDPNPIIASSPVSDLSSIAPQIIDITDANKATLNGPGIYRYTNGSIYEGTLDNGLRTGKGLFCMNNQTTEGNWNNDKLDGECIFIYPNNNIYKGPVTPPEALANGDGLIYYRDDTSMYSGPFIDDNPTGEGILLDNNNKIYSVKYENNVETNREEITNRDEKLTELIQVKQNLVSDAASIQKRCDELRLLLGGQPLSEESLKVEEAYKRRIADERAEEQKREQQTQANIAAGRKIIDNLIEQRRVKQDFLKEPELTSYPSLTTEPNSSSTETKLTEEEINKLTAEIDKITAEIEQEESKNKKEEAENVAAVEAFKVKERSEALSGTGVTVAPFVDIGNPVLVQSSSSSSSSSSLSPIVVPKPPPPPIPIKRQYLIDDNTLTNNPADNNESQSIVLLHNGTAYYGPIRNVLDPPINVTVNGQGYIITLLKISQKFGTVKDKNGDVKLKPTEVPLLPSVVPAVGTSLLTPSSPTAVTWTDILFDATKHLVPDEQWQWTEYFDYFFRIPGIQSITTEYFSKEMEQQLMNNINMDNIVFNTTNLENMYIILGHEITVYTQAIIMTLKYIHENNVAMYTGNKVTTKSCATTSATATAISPSVIAATTSPDVSPLTPETPETPETPFDDAYKLYQSGNISECLTKLEELKVATATSSATASKISVLDAKINLLEILCKIEADPNYMNTINLFTEIHKYDELSDDKLTEMRCNAYYYLYNELPINSELEKEIKDNNFDDISFVRNPLMKNTMANIFSKMTGKDGGKLTYVELADKYRTAYINALTAQNKDNYLKQIDDTMATAIEAEKNLKWTLSKMLYDRAVRYSIVYFGIGDKITDDIKTKYDDFIKKHDKATAGLTKGIESLYKQLTLRTPKSAYQAFYDNYLVTNSITDTKDMLADAKTATKAILASVVTDKPNSDFFKNMEKQIDIQNENIYQLLLILIKNVILCMNLYLIISSKIFQNSSSISSASLTPSLTASSSASLTASLIPKYIEDLNLYYGFKKAYENLITLIETENPDSIDDMEQNPDDIITGNSDFNNMLLASLGLALGLSGLTVSLAGIAGGKKRHSGSRKRHSGSRKKQKVSRKRVSKKHFYKPNKRGIKISRKLRRKHNKWTRSKSKN